MQKRSVIYIHGFGSSGLGGKASLFRQRYRDKAITFVAPSLSYVPDLAIQTLVELIESCSNVVLIGSSLGGFYAIYLATKFNLKAALINPAVLAPTTLRHHTQKKESAKNYYDGSCFEWSDNHLQMLLKYTTQEPKDENMLLLLQKGDEILDYNDALKYLPNAKRIIQEGGSHSFEGVENYFDAIDNFLFESSL